MTLLKREKTFSLMSNSVAITRYSLQKDYKAEIRQKPLLHNCLTLKRLPCSCSLAFPSVFFHNCFLAFYFLRTDQLIPQPSNLPEFPPLLVPPKNTTK